MPERRKMSEIIDALNTAIDESEGEITEAIAALDLEFADKAEAYAAIITEKKTKIVANKILKDKYAANMLRLDADIEWLQDNLIGSMKQAGTADLRTPTAHIWIQRNERLEVDEAVFCAKYPYHLFPELYNAPKFPAPSKEAIKARTVERVAAMPDSPTTSKLDGVTVETTETLRIK